MEGELRLATLRVIGGKLKYTSAQPGQSFGQVDVEADITFPPPDSRITEASASAKIAGSVYGTTGFNLSGTGQMNIPIVGERTGRMLLLAHRPRRLHRPRLGRRRLQLHLAEPRARPLRQVVLLRRASRPSPSRGPPGPGRA